MKFTIQKLIDEWHLGEVHHFDENDAPAWLTSVNTIPGSTMDARWFWNDHVLKLNVGQHIDTDFTRITRIE